MAMVRDLPLEDRPRERLISHGSEHLSNAELLAILIRSGSKDKSAIQLAEEVLGIYKESGIHNMSQVTVAELTKLKGIGEAKAAEIIAAIELGRRLSVSKNGNVAVVSGPEDVAAYAIPRLSYQQKEHFCVMLMNIKNHILSMQTISVGSLTASVVHPREVFKAAVQQSAASMILIHNHPSGDPTPSREDIVTTNRMVSAGKVMDIPVLDHIIIGNNRFISMKEKGLIA